MTFAETDSKKFVKKSIPKQSAEVLISKTELSLSNCFFFFRLSWVPLREIFWWGGIVIFVFCLPIRMDNLNLTKNENLRFLFSFLPT